MILDILKSMIEKNILLKRFLVFFSINIIIVFKNRVDHFIIIFNT